MEFTDEIALTGELSEIGLPLRRNVDESYRRGLEVDLQWLASSSWSLLHSANLSRNRIREWTQFYDVYDAGGALVGSEPITYRDVPPLLTPEVILNLGAEWTRRESSLALDRPLRRRRPPRQHRPRPVSGALLHQRRPARLARTWAAGGRRQAPRSRSSSTTCSTSDEQYPGGYSYQFINRDGAGRDSLDGIPFYYPLATRNAVISLELDL